MSEPKFEIGELVYVQHHQGWKWVGQITYRANTDGDYWEYEVSNSPFDMTRIELGREDHITPQPGYRWHPLAWESELKKVPDYGADC